MIVLDHVGSVLAAATAVAVGGAYAQATMPTAESVGRPLTRAPQLDVNEPACRPVYPDAARAEQVEGESHLILRFEAVGKFVSVRMPAGAPATLLQHQLDIAAARALSTCPFHPGQDADGKPVGGDVEVTHRWILEPPRDGGEARIVTKGRECKPGYPVAALRAGAQGTTRLAFRLDETGKVLGVDVVQSAGQTREHHLLDAAAAQGLATCTFRPVRDAENHPVPGTVFLTYAWRLE